MSASLLQMSFVSNITQQHEVCTNASHVCAQSSHNAVAFPVRIQSDIGSVIRARVHAHRKVQLCASSINSCSEMCRETSAGS
jgi:hypothetical protein